MEVEDTRVKEAPEEEEEQEVPSVEETQHPGELGVTDSFENNTQGASNGSTSSTLDKVPCQGDGSMVDIDLNQPSDSEISEDKSSIVSFDSSVDNTSSTNSSPIKTSASEESRQGDQNSAIENASKLVQNDQPLMDSESDVASTASESAQTSESPVLLEKQKLTDLSIQPHIPARDTTQDGTADTSSEHSITVIKDCKGSSKSEVQPVQHSENSSKNDQFQNSEELLTCDSPKNKQSGQSLESTRSDDNDVLLSELDAELEISESPIENDLADLPNGMRRRKISLSDIPEYKELKSRYESLQKHLEQQIMDSQRLKSESEKMSISLTTALRERDAYLEKIQSLENKGDDSHIVHIKELEFSLAKQQKEVNQMKEKMSSHDLAAKRAVSTLQGELKLRVDQVTKQLEDCKKEKETMVMKYAAAEAKNIEMQEKMYKNERRVAEFTREKDSALAKYKQMKEEKKKMQEIYENRAMEISSLRREIERLKELINTADIKGKWAHNKLKVELEAHKETKGKVEDLEKKLRLSKEECDLMKRQCDSTIKSLQESEEAKARNLDGKLKETQCELMLHKQEKSDQDEVSGILRRELESLKNKHKDLLEELKLYKDKVLCLDEERLHQEQTLTRFKDTLQSQKIENTEMREQLDRLQNIETEVIQMKAQIDKSKKRVEDIEQVNRDLIADIDACAARESEYLELQQKLSDKNVVLQSESARLSINLSKLTQVKETLTSQGTELASKVKTLEQELEMVKKAREEETSNLSTDLEKKTKEVEDLTRKVEEEKDEIKTLKRKHAANTKDLLRQLQQGKRKLELLDRGEKDITSVGSMGSRTSSNGSLDTVGNNAMTRSVSQENTPSPVQEEIHPIVEVVEIDKNMLMDKIVKLQKIHARKNEKIDFVEDHNRQLLEEVRKKARIIQHYALREEAGTLSSEESDNNKRFQARTEAKAQIAKKGGIMASLYTQHVLDGSMTVEMSLEITQKLQQVLEDTLIKNITLKDNLETLGQEIARLSKENRRLQIQIQDLQGGR